MRKTKKKSIERIDPNFAIMKLRQWRNWSEEFFRELENNYEMLCAVYRKESLEVLEQLNI